MAPAIRISMLAVVVFLFSPIAGATNYTYDVLNRLTAVEYSNGISCAYAYDAGGNLLAATVRNLTPGTSASQYANAVQQLYIAYFGRPADPGGLSNFEAALLVAGAPVNIQDLVATYSTNSAVRALIDSFGTSAESARLYTGDTTAFVTAVFTNIFNRPPGGTFWIDAINSGSVTRGLAALSIMAGALANTSAQGLLDAATVNNKVTAAGNFTSSLTTTAQIRAYSGQTAAATVRTMLAGVTSATDITAFQSTIASTVAALVAVAPAGMAPPQSYAITGDQAQQSVGNIHALVPLAASPNGSGQGSVSIGPLSGMWSNANEPGWGMSITQHDTMNFVVVYSYDPVGQPIWYAMPSCPLVGLNCTGDIYSVTGGTQPTQSWNGARLSVNRAGIGTLFFSDDANATYSFSMNGLTGSRSITKRAFAPDQTSPAVDYTDLWWNSAEPGWGVTLNQQQGSLFVTMNTYDWIGQPTWYVASSCPLVDTGCTGDLYQVTGGDPLTSVWYATSKANNVGVISFAFTDSSHATMSYSINGVTASKSIARQTF